MTQDHDRVVLEDAANAAPPVCVTCLFGKPKRAKTSAALAAFPDALWIGVEPAIRPVAENEYGYTPAIWPSQVRTLPELSDLIEYIHREGYAQQYGAICIDDVTLMAKTSVQFWKDNPRMTKNGKVDNYYPYQELDRQLLKISGLARYMGLHIVFICHERLPGSNARDVFIPGGPELGSSTQVMRVPAWCDLNARAVTWPESPDPWLPMGWYVNPFNAQWATGDRTGVCGEHTPPNLREILRASETPYRISPRIPGLEWQEGVAEEVAEAIVAKADYKLVMKQIEQTSQVNPLHLRWACQDGIARGILRVQKAQSLFDFDSGKGVATTSPTGGGGAPPPPPPPTADA